jgi:hypothetical protein
MGGVIFKWIFEIGGMVVFWIYLVQDRVSGVPCEHSNEPSGFIKCLKVE